MYGMRSPILPPRVKSYDQVPPPDINEEPQIVEYKEPGYVEVLNNQIYFYADIDRDKMLLLMKTLRDKENELLHMQQVWGLESAPPIHLYVQSYGGFAHAGFSGYDQIRSLKVPVYTYVDGVAASAATLLTIAGKKRFIQRNSVMMIHQARAEYWGMLTHEELKDDMENSKKTMEMLKRVYMETTKMNQNDLEKILDHDLYFDAQTCLEKGLVDEILG